MSSCTPAAKKVLDGLMAEKGNERCVDCGSKLSVDWASVNLGVYFCIDCSGRHRSYGVHISFVRSITMDKWDDRQLAYMKAGGNKACKAFLKEHDCYELPPAQRWASKGAEKWRQKLREQVEGGMRKKKKKAASSSEESDSDSSSDDTSSSEDEAPVSKKEKPVATAKAAKLPAKTKPTQALSDLIDLGGGAGSLDDFFADSPTPKALSDEECKAKEKAKKEKKKKEKEKKAQKSSGSDSDSAAKKKKSKETVALDNASLDERIQKRKEERDREREREALAKLEAICGSGGGGGESWGNVNPPGKAAAASDSDSDDSDAERERQEKKRRAREKEKKKAAKDAARAGSAESSIGNPAPGGFGSQPESTMQRMRREAAEEKARKEKERQEHMSQFSGKNAISSSDYFGGAEDQSDACPAQRKARDYSKELDGYKGEAPLAHAILHKGILAKETLTIAKDRLAESAPEVAGKAGKAAVAAASSAASFLKENAGGWLASAAQRVGVASNSMSASSGSWIDQEARRRAELSKNAGKDLTKSGGFGDGAKGGMQGFGSEHLGGGDFGGSDPRSGGFGLIGKGGGGGKGLIKSGSGLALDSGDLDKWLDSDVDSDEDGKKKKKKDKSAAKPKSKEKDFFASSASDSDDEPKKKKKDKETKKEKKAKRSSRKKGDTSDEEDAAKVKKSAAKAPPKSVDLIDLLS